MSTFPVCDDDLDPAEELYELRDVAELLSVPVTRVHQMLRDHRFLAVRRDGAVGIPPEFLDAGSGRVVKRLQGAILVLRDGGYADQEILRWLFTDDPTLPGRPADALRGRNAREVLRRAQAKAF